MSTLFLNLKLGSRNGSNGEGPRRSAHKRKPASKRQTNIRNADHWLGRKPYFEHCQQKRSSTSVTSALYMLSPTNLISLNCSKTRGRRVPTAHRNDLTNPQGRANESIKLNMRSFLTSRFAPKFLTAARAPRQTSWCAATASRP